MPDPEHCGPGAAIIVNGTPYLVELGARVVQQAAAARQEGVLGLGTVALGICYASALGSHAGIACVMLTPWVKGRKQPLELYGPPGTRAMVDNILKAYEADIRLRTAWLEHSNSTGYK